MSIVTFGLYHLYWFYRNFKLVKDQEGAELSPVLRSMFAPFTSHTLFKRVKQSAKEKNYSKNFSVKLLTGLYLIIGFLRGGAQGLSAGELLVQDVFWTIITTLILFPVQKAINYNNSQTKEENGLKTGFTKGEYVFMAIGVLLWIGGLLLMAV